MIRSWSSSMSSGSTTWGSMVMEVISCLPVTLTAVPSGGIWTGWSDGVKDSVRMVVPGDVGTITAVFK